MKKRLPKTLFVLFVTLLCILIPAYDVMTAYSAMINNALNIQSYRVVESDIAAHVRLRRVVSVPVGLAIYTDADDDYLRREAGLYPDMLVDVSRCC